MRKGIITETGEASIPSNLNPSVLKWALKTDAIFLYLIILIIFTPLAIWAHWSLSILGLVLLIYFFRVHTFNVKNMSLANVCPAVLIQEDPPTLAVLSNLAYKSDDILPALKIVELDQPMLHPPFKLNKGDRHTCLVGYFPDEDSEAAYEDLNAEPSVYYADEEECAQLVSMINEEEWQYLVGTAAQIDTTELEHDELIPLYSTQ